MFLVPWQVPAFAGLFVAIHAVLAVAPLAYVQWAYVTFSLVPIRFLADDGTLVALAFANLLSYGFIHQGWLHVLINVAMLMAAAGPVNRNCGPVRMVLLFSLCCIAGGICHVLVYWGESVPVIGASAGAAGVIGAAIRYRARQLSRGEIVAPIFRPPVSTFSMFWIGINLLLFTWDSLGGGAISGYATIAHIGGYVAGLYLAPVLVKGVRPPARFRTG